MGKAKKTEFAQVEKFLKTEGFTEITEKEKKMPEFRHSVINSTSLQKQSGRQRVK